MFRGSGLSGTVWEWFGNLFEEVKFGSASGEVQRFGRGLLTLRCLGDRFGSRAARFGRSEGSDRFGAESD